MSYVLDKLPHHGRQYVALGAAFTVATVLRNICLNPRYPIFGPHLARELAPIERDDISYLYIVGVRLWDLTLAIYVWSREAKGHKTRTDAPVLGMLLCLLTRVPLYIVLRHYFLLSTTTLSQILITDVFALAAAMWTISKIEPKAPAFFKTPATDDPIRQLDRSTGELALYAVGITTLVNALYGYVSERLYLQRMIRENVLDVQMPSYFSALNPSFAEALKNPTLAIPILRSAMTPQSMPTHIFSAVPLAVITLLLVLLYMPKKSPIALAGLAFLLTAPSNGFSTFNLLPIKPAASAIIGLENGVKAAVAAFIISWVTEDWRRGQIAPVLRDISKGGQGDQQIVVTEDSVIFREKVPADADATQ